MARPFPFGRQPWMGRLYRGGYTGGCVPGSCRQSALVSGGLVAAIPSSVPSIDPAGPASAGVRGMKRIRTGDGTCNPVAWSAGVTVPPLYPVPMVVSVSRSPARPRWGDTGAVVSSRRNRKVPEPQPDAVWPMAPSREFVCGNRGIPCSRNGICRDRRQLYADVIAVRKMSTGLGRNRPKSHRYPISVAFTSSPTKGTYCRKLSANMLTSLVACSS